MFFFALELVVASMVKDDYWMGFYFWLDLLATVSMISDIGWAWEEILGTDQSGSSSGVTKSTQLARAARASRAGTRAGRIIRMVRIVRLIRLVKIYKITQEANAENQHGSSKLLYRSYVTYRGAADAITIPREEKMSVLPVSSNEELSMSQSMDLDPLVEHPLDLDPHPSAILIGSTRTSTMFDFGRFSVPKQIAIPEEITENVESKASEEGNSNLPPLEESNVGHRLSELTTKRVILLVLGMMFVLPLFSNSMYVDENSSYVYGLKLLDRVSETDSLDIVWENFLQQHENLFTPVIFIEVLGRKTWQKVDPQDLRSVEQQIATMDQTQGSRYYVSPT